MLRFASEELWGDKEVVIEAARQDDGSALRFASEVLWRDKEVVMEALQHHCGELEFASKKE